MLDLPLGFLLKSITDKIKARVDADMKRHNLTLSQSRILKFLTENGGESTQKEIEDFLQVAHPTVVGLVSRMEQNGFVRSWLDPENRRNKIVRLTPHAQDISQQIARETEEIDRRLLCSFTPQQVRQLKEMLLQISQSLD